MTPHVVISDSKSTTVDHDLQRDVLRGYDVTASSAVTRTEATLLAELGDASGLIVDAGVPVTARVIEGTPSLEVVGRAGIGVDNVDLEAAADHGVTVVHNPTYSIDEVATHALALLLACVRRLPTYDRQTRGGGWDWSEGSPIGRLQGSTIGFLGFGKIPRRLATMVQGFGCELIAHDPYLPTNVVRTHNVEPVGLDDLLARVDLLSIHVPHTDETERMIDADALAAMADDAVLVNTARGPVVDTDALVSALASDELDFAGLDVVDPEPLPADHALSDLENAIVTPHVGWYSESSRRQLSEEIAEDVGRVLVGEAPRNEVSADSEWV